MIATTSISCLRRFTVNLRACPYHDGRSRRKATRTAEQSNCGRPRGSNFPWAAF